MPDDSRLSDVEIDRTVQSAGPVDLFHLDVFIDTLVEDDKIYAPVTGKIGAMVDTGHAVGFISEDGVEVLVHIGMDTVNYEKDYFHLEKKVGDYVQAGDVIGHFDLKTLIYDERNVKTPVVIPTKKDKIKINLLKEGPIDLETEIMEIVF